MFKREKHDYKKTVSDISCDGAFFLLTSVTEKRRGFQERDYYYVLLLRLCRIHYESRKLVSACHVPSDRAACGQCT